MAVFHTAERRNAKTGLPERDAGSARHTAAIDSAASRDVDAAPSAFARRLWRAAERFGFAAAKGQVVVADGAKWIWNAVAELFPNAVRIVDIRHARERLREVGRSVYGAGTELCRAWSEKVCAALSEAHWPDEHANHPRCGNVALVANRPRDRMRDDSASNKQAPMNKPREVAYLGTERDPPPYFAGRKAELGALNKRLNALCRCRNTIAGIALIMGVPGVGKTQLAHQFAQAATDRDGPVDVRWLDIDRTLLKSEIGLFEELAIALGMEELGKEIADLDTRRTGGSVGVGPVKGSSTWESARRQKSLFELLRESKRKGMWDDKAVVLTIDELQGLQADEASALEVLHKGTHGCPLLLVGVGLQHLQSVLSGYGISRVADPIRVASLSESETVEAIGRGLQAMGHVVSAQGVAPLAAASFGFPQHIHEYLRGAECAIELYGHLEPGSALDHAIKVGNQGRANYYDARLVTLDDQDAILPVVEAMILEGRSSLRKSEAIAAVDKAKLDGKGVVNDAIRHGVLSMDRGAVSFGIPSFHSHMVNEHERLERGVEPPCQAEMRTDASAYTVDRHHVSRP